MENSMSTELLETVRAGNIERARQILASGADINSRDSEGSTLLMLASHAGDLPMVIA